MKHVRGAALPLGVTISEEKINFSVAAAPDSVCELCLYKNIPSHFPSVNLNRNH